MITIYCDGSSKGNPGPGGYGVIIIGENKVVEFGNHYPHTTNNRMELQAAIDACKYIKDNNIIDELHVFTDSQYVIKGITEWIHNWKKNNFRTANKKPVLNEDLWQELDLYNTTFHMKWNYVRGHSGIPGNERADAIANAFADRSDIELYSGNKANYNF